MNQKNKPKTIVGIGSALVDILVQLEDDQLLDAFQLPKGSMTLVDAVLSQKILDSTEGLERSIETGGSAANTVRAIAQLGGKAGFIGKISNDPMGHFFKDEFEKNQITPHLFYSQIPTGKATTLISPDSERTFATFLGAAVELTAEDIPHDLFADYAYFHIEGYLVQNQQLIKQALKSAREHGLIVSLDLASFNVVEDNLAFLREMVRDYVDILFANEEEAKAFTNGLEDHAALDWMSELCDIIILKKGPNGSYIKHLDTVFKVSAIKASPIDTTGAGDLYAAGFLFGLIHALPMETCGHLGALLSARVIEVMGPKMNDELWDTIRAEVEILKG